MSPRCAAGDGKVKTAKGAKRDWRERRREGGRECLECYVGGTHSIQSSQLNNEKNFGMYSRARAHTYIHKCTHMHAHVYLGRSKDICGSDSRICSIAVSIKKIYIQHDTDNVLFVVLRYAKWILLIYPAFLYII